MYDRTRNSRLLVSKDYSYDGDANMKRRKLQDDNTTTTAMVSESQETEPLMPTFTYLNVTSPSPAICHCALNRPPVNALNTAVWTELLALLTHLEAHAFPTHTTVLLFTSQSRGDIFSAGNDLKEVFVPATTEERFHHFWNTSTTFLSRLYVSPLTTIAALRGATPAAGCILSLCCDVRIALHDVSMGLNEVAIGLTVPAYWARVFLRTANSRAQAERLLLTGDMLTAREAKELGVVDEIVQGDKADLHDRALTIATEWAKRGRVAHSRAQTKRNMHEDFAADWLNSAAEEASSAWQMLSNPRTIGLLGVIMQNLRKRPARM